LGGRATEPDGSDKNSVRRYAAAGPNGHSFAAGAELALARGAQQVVIGLLKHQDHSVEAVEAAVV
jgi:hypothetical protein